MIPGGEQIVACPHCGALEKYMRVASGNTFGLRLWTDAKQLAPMLPRPPACVKCHHCEGCYWLAEAREVGVIDSWSTRDELVDPAWTDAPEVDEPTEEEYYRAIHQGVAADPRQEKLLRTLAWWRRNDAFRGGGNGSAVTAAGACRENLESLASLLDETDNNGLLMKAEVLRELGEFESAKLLLGRVVLPQFAGVVRQIRALCDSGETCVRELDLERGR